MTKSNRDLLDDLFAEAAETPAAPSDDFMSRIMADAVALQPQSPSLVSAQVPPASQGFLSRIWEGMGGWSAFAGLTTATLAGVWIGVDTPAVADGVMSLYFESATDVTFVDNDFGWVIPSEETEL